MLLPLAPLGLGVMFVLGRRTVASIKESQLRANRTAAQQAAEKYLMHARRIAAQDSATTQGRINRRLQDAFTELAAELSTSAERNKMASARSIKADWDSRRARLATVDSDIARLRALAGAPGTPSTPGAAATGGGAAQ
jgi:hypothetical protein